MHDLLNYCIESILSLGLFYIFYVLVLERENTFRFNRFYLLVTPLLSLVFPLIRINLPGTVMSLGRITSGFIIRLNEVVIGGNNIPGSGENTFTQTELLLFIYLSGIVITAVLFIIKLSSLFRFIRNNKVERSGKYSFLVSNSDVLSFSFFHFIFIGRNNYLTEEDRNRIRQHEMAHVDQNHSYDSLYFEILAILFWFNPFIWLYKKLVIDIHEYLADEAVINRTGLEGYGYLLARQVIGVSDLQPASHFKNSKTIKRIKKMKTYNRKPNKLIIALFLPLVLLVFLMISCNDNNGQSLQGINEENVSKESPAGTAEVRKSETTLSGEEVYSQVNEMPEPKSGLNEYFKYIQANIKYPEEAKSNGVEGTTFISFIIDKEGNFRDVKIEKGFNELCDSEALRIVKASDPWKPGKKDGTPVNVRMILPVKFALGEK